MYLTASFFLENHHHHPTPPKIKKQKCSFLCDETKQHLSPQLIPAAISGERLPNLLLFKHECMEMGREMVGTRISRARFVPYKKLREKKIRSLECDGGTGFTQTPHICRKQAVDEPGWKSFHIAL